MQSQHGRFLIECKSALLGAVLGFVISLIFVFSLYTGRNLSRISFTADLLGWSLTILFGILALYCLRLIIKPLTMVVITDKGILFFYHANARLRSPVFIPWNNISELNLVKREKSSHKGRMFTVNRIEARIINRHTLSIPDRMFNYDTDTIDIDENPMAPCGRALLLSIDNVPEAKTSPKHN